MIHRPFSPARLFKIIPVILLALAVFSFLFLSLWNWLMPVIFNLPVINFWQALGLLVLSKIIFSGFGPGKRHHKISPEMRERFERYHQMRHGKEFDPEKNNE